MTKASDKIENITAEDLISIVYGNIQTMIEGNLPKNFLIQYFQPFIPFGPELAGFMEIGPKKKKLTDAGYTVADMMRAAVNFSNIVDYVTVMPDEDPDNESTNIISLPTLVSSGVKITDVYRSILNNCRVVDNSRSEEDQAKLEKLRALLYKDYPEEAGADSVKEPGQSSDEDDDLGLNDDDNEQDEDALLADLLGETTSDEDEEVPLAGLFDDGVSSEDFLVDPDQIAPPTKLMAVYEALLVRHEVIILSVLDELKKISPNDPNAGLRKKILKKKIRASKNRLEAQGRATAVKAVIAKIEQYSQGGMPQYLSNLRARMEGLEIIASIFASEEEGSSLISETGYYTALRPNGVLSAPALMKVEISSSSSSISTRFEHKSTSGKVKGSYAGFGVSASASKASTKNAVEALGEDFSISFEITQAIIDRAFLDLSFLESPAYTTIDPESNEALDPMMQITSLSDGGSPPTGLMPAISTVAYFVKKLSVTSSKLATMSSSERDSLTAGGGISYMGFGASGQHHKNTVETDFSKAGTKGSITANGTYLVALGSRYLKKSPNPNFEAFPKDKWI